MEEIKFATKESLKEIEMLSKQFSEEGCCNCIKADNEKFLAKKEIAIYKTENKIVAYTYGTINKENKNRDYAKIGEKYFSLDEMYVIPSYRNLGIGKKLYKFLEEYAKLKNCKTLRLDAVSKDYEKLLSFYIKDLKMDFLSAYLIKKL